MSKINQQIPEKPRTRQSFFVSDDDLALINNGSKKMIGRNKKARFFAEIIEFYRANKNNTIGEGAHPRKDNSKLC